MRSSAALQQASNEEQQAHSFLCRRWLLSAICCYAISWVVVAMPTPYVLNTPHVLTEPCMLPASRVLPTLQLLACSTRALHVLYTCYTHVLGVLYVCSTCALRPKFSQHHKKMSACCTHLCLLARRFTLLKSLRFLPCHLPLVCFFCACIRAR